MGHGGCLATPKHQIQSKKIEDLPIGVAAKTHQFFIFYFFSSGVVRLAHTAKNHPSSFCLFFIIIFLKNLLFLINFYIMTRTRGGPSIFERKM
jgi:hypothetical protein